ncbi:MAG: pyridoxamine 5'-phosphate oxidase family protein [Candidatus Limnocylindrales bacterium]
MTDLALTLPTAVRDFLAADRFVSIATTDRDGSPRQAVVWYRLDGDVVVLNSKIGRRWPANVLHDPRVALSIIDVSDSNRWVGLTGRVVEAIRERAIAQADIAGMARRYHASDPERAARVIRGFETQERISFHVRIEAVHDHLAG